MNGIYYKLIDIHLHGKYNYFWDGSGFESLRKQTLPWLLGRFLPQFSGVDATVTVFLFEDISRKH